MDKEYIIIFAGVINLFLSLLVLQKNKKSLVNKSFLIFAVASSIWSLAIFFYTHPVLVSAYEWIKITYFLSFFTIPAFFYFLSSFCGKKPEFVLRSLGVYFIVIAVSIWVLFFTNWWIVDVIQQPWGYHTITGPFYPVFGIVAGVYVVWGFKLLLGKLRSDKGQERNQTKYVLIGIVLYCLSAFLVDIIFPIFFGVSRYFWTSPVAVIFFIVFAAFAITKYHLFDIKIILTEILVGTMGIVLVMAVFLADSTRTKILSLSILFLFLFIGYLLIRSTYQELKREETLKMSMRSLENINKKLKLAHERIIELEGLKDAFIPIATNELNVPLTAIKNYLWMLEKGEGKAKLSSTQEKEVKKITEKTKKLLAGLLKFSHGLNKKT